MKIILSGSDLQGRLCPVLSAQGSISVEIDDGPICDQILALLLPTSPGVKVDKGRAASLQPARRGGERHSAMTAAEIAAAMNSGDLPGVCSMPAVYRATTEGTVTFDVSPGPGIRLAPASAPMEGEGPPWQCGDILEGARGPRPILVGLEDRRVEVWPYDKAEDFEPRVWSEARAFESLGPFRRIGCVTPEVVQRVRGGDEEAAATIVRTAYPPAEG